MPKLIQRSRGSGVQRKATPRNGKAPAETMRGIGGSVLIPVEKIHPHPSNRRVNTPDCADLAQSFEREGQLNEVILWEPPASVGLPIGHYQLIAGERRWRAAQICGWPSIRAKVLPLRDEDGQARALELLAIDNAQREDLDDISRAFLISKLCDPPNLGGAGLTREQAGRIYGLSASGASNLVRLLELPKVWQERVRSGELPQTFARELLPYLGAKSLMQRIDAEYQRDAKHEESRWSSRIQVRNELESLVDRHTRPMDPNDTRYYGWNKVRDAAGSYGRLFEVDEKTRKALKIVQLPGEDGQPAEYATDVKRYDQLQRSAINRAYAAKQKAKAKQSKRQASQPKPKTAAEAKEAAQRQAKQYAKRLQAWRIELLRRHLAGILKPGNWQVTKAVLWIAFSLDERDRNAIASEALKAAGCQLRDFGYWSGERQQVSLDLQELELETVRAALWRSEPITLQDQVVEGLAADYRVDLEAVWRGLQSGAKDPQFEAFFQLHNKDQLVALAKELKVNIDGGTKGQMVKLFCRPERMLPLPQRVRRIATTNVRRRKK